MSSTVACSSCGTENQSGSRFCNQCGAAMSPTCAACGHQNAPGSRFCNECGATLITSAAQVASPAPPRTASVTPTRAERRLVSVLFTDLVGFTTFSEHRDPEEVRAFLTRYFDRSREIVERFGGTIEKFIGDAVMAVWGTVEARENDAERAVRAGLELVDMVQTLGGEIGVPELRLRAGVLTGETAVGPGGNESTGMIVGDLVNSASRLQSSAAPGTVYVGEATQRISSGAILYESVGLLEMKGKSEPIEAFRAVRVIAQRGGRGASEGIEPPFVGRDDEFRILKDQIHATSREKGARLVSIVGEPGIGKTRITWELEKYIDGITDAIYWHHGRSPDYGEGLTFWALAEMIRQRAGIAELDDPAKSRMKLRTAVAQYAPTEEDQRWIEPRLAGLLGLEEMPAGERGEMFAAIRTFFQRIAELGTTVLVFEDLHWADDGLIDFITELVERSARSPILVVTLARPDLLDRYPGWGSGRRNSMSMQLAPLSEESMRSLVEGTVPGLPADAVETVIARAGGVPLYAVEFIRMLMSTGDVVRNAEGRYELVGDLSDLSVPETVQAVIGSRLDRLGPEDRALLQDGSVLGLSFTPVALAGIRGERVEEIRERLLSLVRDELLELEEDPRSPERGQYRFVQGLIREVAYGRLGREDRAERHLRAARYYEELGDLELAAALATHYMAAFEASRGATDLVVKARNALVGAAKRAAELHAHRQVISLLTKALEISPEAVDATAVLERLSEASFIAGDNEAAIRFALDAEERSRAVGDDSGRKRAATLAARAYTSSFHTSDAQAHLEPLYDPECVDADAVTLDMELELARSYMFGDPPRSLQIAERALSRDRGALSPATLINGIINRGNALGGVGRAFEARALMRGVVEVADELGLQRQAIRALWNLGVLYQFDDLQRANEMGREVLERARRIGDQNWAQMSLDASALADMLDGRFADSAATLAEFDDPDLPEAIRLQAEYSKTLLKLYQRPNAADFVHTRRVLDTLITDADLMTQREIAHSEIDLLEGDFSAAANRRIVYVEAPAVPIHAYLAAMWVGDQGVMSQAAGDMAAGNPGRYVDAVATLLRASFLAIGGDRETAATGYRTAIEALSRVGMAMETAIARAVFAKRIGLDHPEAAAAASMARAFLEQVGAHQVLQVLADGLPAEARVAATGS